MTTSCLKGDSGPHGYGAFALFMGTLWLTAMGLLISLVTLPFTRLRAIGTVALAGTLGSAFVLWLLEFRERPGSIGDALSAMIGR